MCGRSSAGSRPAGWGLSGIDTGDMSPGRRISAALSVLVPVALSGFLLIVLFPGHWWIFTTYGWVALPAFGQLLRGVASFGDNVGPEQSAAEAKERELLVALQEHGELTPARAAAETSLSVAEANRMLEGLAGDGQLEVRARGGGLYYAMWGESGRHLPTEPYAGVRRER